MKTLFTYLICIAAFFAFFATFIFLEMNSTDQFALNIVFGLFAISPFGFLEFKLQDIIQHFEVKKYQNQHSSVNFQ